MTDPIKQTKRSESTSIVTGSDIKVRLKFFGAVLVQSAIDLLLLFALFLVLALGKLIFEQFERSFPKQVKVVHVGEYVGLGATTIICLWFIILDVIRTVRRSWRVMLREE